MRFLYVVVFIFSTSLLIALPPSAGAQSAGNGSFSVVISTRILERGQVISPGDVELIRTNRNDPRALKDLNSVIGKLLKRTIGRNTAIKRDYLLDAASNRIKRVHRGGEIIIIARKEGIRVSANGRLLKGAKIGEMVEIENLSSGKILSGRLIDANTVTINF